MSIKPICPACCSTDIHRQGRSWVCPNCNYTGRPRRLTKSQKHVLREASRHGAYRLYRAEGRSAQVLERLGLGRISRRFLEPNRFYTNLRGDAVARGNYQGTRPESLKEKNDA